MKAKEMEQHILEICQRQGIEVTYYAGSGRATPHRRRIKIKEVKGINTYYTALHEIGHILARGRSGRKLEAEAICWQWAITHAIYPPTEAVDKMIARCLRSYLSAGRRRYGLRQGMVEPPWDHVFWKLANPPSMGDDTVTRMPQGSAPFRERWV